MNAVVQLCEACGEAPAHTDHEGWQLCRLCMLDEVAARECSDEAQEVDSNETLGLRR